MCAKFGTRQLAWVPAAMATLVNKNILHIYVIWFQRKLNWFQFKAEVKN